MTDEPLDDRADRLQALLNQTVTRLMEHFDAVEVIASVQVQDPEDHNDPKTVTVHDGNGNWNARYGMVRIWLTKQEEGILLDYRRSRDKETPP